MFVNAGGVSPAQIVADTWPIFPDEVISFKNMSRVSVAVHPEAVSTRTDTEVVEDKGGIAV